MWVCTGGSWSVLVVDVPMLVGGCGFCNDGCAVSLRQWLLVAIVAAVVDVPLLSLMLLMVMRGRR